MKPFIILVMLSIVLASCADPVGDTEPVGDKEAYWWRAKRVNGCVYIVPVYGYDAITHAGNCDNHDTTKKEIQEINDTTNATK